MLLMASDEPLPPTPPITAPQPLGAPTGLPEPAADPEPEPAPEPTTFEDDVRNLVRVAGEAERMLHADWRSAPSRALAVELSEAIASVEAWADAHQDPQRDGWVGANGQP